MSGTLAPGRRAWQIGVIKGTPPTLDQLMETMTLRARNMNVDKIKPADVVRTGGAPEAAD